MSEISRRSFLKLVNRSLTATGLAAIVGPVVAYFYPPKLEEMPSEPVQVCNTKDLPVGASKAVPFGRYPALIINIPGGLRAYSAVCTHFACICKWDEAKGLIACPCHDGYFDPEDGKVLSGPPPTGLSPLVVNIIDGEIYIGGEA